MTNWDELIAALKCRGVEFAAPLTEAETVTVEERFQFTFPFDLRTFLQTGLPVGRRFPDWRNGDHHELADWLNRPREGVLFDVEHNNFWLDEWGPRPADLESANMIVNKLIDEAPKLIPIYMHRMMSSEPKTAGNPVFSVHQTDIIAYGVDLADYFIHEFMFTEEQMDDWTVPQNFRAIRFWDIERFQDTRWGPDGSCVFDNSRGILP